MKKRVNVANQKRAYLKQSDVPGASLDEALRVPQAILDHYAGRPVPPLNVAKALNMDPKGSQIRVLTGAGIAFGLIEGGAQATSINVTDLARRILRPKVEGDEIAGRREAVLRPRVFGEFLKQYDQHGFPRRDLVLNVIEEMGVPREKGNEVLDRLETSARSVGLIETIKDKLYVSLGGAGSGEDQSGTAELEVESDQRDRQNGPQEPEEPKGSATNPALLVSRSPLPIATAMATAIADDQRRRRVFITHGKDRAFVEPIRKLLEYGEMEPVISVDRQSVSKPVPEKVMDDMRGSGAAIIHVDAETSVVDAAGNTHVFLNPNVLIEIGAAMAFYGRRFILLVRDGVKLPPNLQGLYEVRYSEEKLDADATIKLLDAIKDIKNYALPNGEIEES